MLVFIDKSKIKMAHEKGLLGHIPMAIGVVLEGCLDGWDIETRLGSQKYPMPNCPKMPFFSSNHRKGGNALNLTTSLRL